MIQDAPRLLSRQRGIHILSVLIEGTSMISHRPVVLSGDCPVMALGICVPGREECL
jgi:N-formylglutamate amidohydrolase